MELIAVIVLGLVTFVSFSTTERPSEIKTISHPNDDPDWAFTQSGDLNDNSSERRL